MITGTLMSSANWIPRPKLFNEGEFQLTKYSAEFAMFSWIRLEEAFWILKKDHFIDEFTRDKLTSIEVNEK